MKPGVLTCPHARYIEGMRIYCDAANGLCGNVFYKQCKGWWALNENAERCPLRRRDHDGQTDKAAEGSHH